jgi:Flp pilus assembly pilin Flp
MDGLVVSVGNGIASLMTGVYTAIGNALRGIVNAGNHALPYGLFWVLIVVLLVIGAWTLAKR